MGFPEGAIVYGVYILPRASILRVCAPGWTEVFIKKLGHSQRGLSLCVNAVCDGENGHFARLKIGPHAVPHAPADLAV